MQDNNKVNALTADAKQHKDKAKSELQIANIETKEAKRIAKSMVQPESVKKSQIRADKNKDLAASQRKPVIYQSEIVEQPNKSYMFQSYVSQKGKKQDRQDKNQTSRNQESQVSRSTANFVNSQADRFYQSQLAHSKQLAQSHNGFGVSDPNIGVSIYDNPSAPESRPFAPNRKPRQPVGINDILNDWDKFTINRAFPGASNAPYLNNMTVAPLPTGTFSVSKAISTLYNHSTSLYSTPGTADYVVVLFCPSLSSFMGNGSGGYYSTSTRLAGIQAFQTDSLSQSVTSQHFSYTPTALTCSSAYGSDFTTFAQGGFVWASTMRMRILAPAANLVGAAYKGVMTVGQLLTGMTVGQMIQDATVTETGSYEQILRSSVINPALVDDISDPSIGSLPCFPGGENEPIAYCVYQTAAASITTGTKMPYNLIWHFEGNFVYYPKATDTFAFSLTPEERRGNATFERNTEFSKVVSPLVNSVVDNPSNYTSLFGKLKNVLGGALSWADDKFLMGAAKKFDDGVLGGSVQELLGVKTAAQKEEDMIQAMLLDLKFNSGLAPVRSTYSSAFNGTSLNTFSTKYAPMDIVANPLVPKDDFVYYFTQLKDMCARARGTNLQMEQLQPFFESVNAIYAWYQTAPDFIHLDDLGKDKVKKEDPDRQDRQGQASEQRSLSVRKGLIPQPVSDLDDSFRRHT